MSEQPSLQERYALNNRCFGCGPANEQGLRIRSFPTHDDDDRAEVVAQWVPGPHHLAFEGIVNGGIIGALLDCHSNWTAAWSLMRRDNLGIPPCTVTAEFHVKMKHPTPLGPTLHLSARVAESTGNRVTVAATLAADGRVTATCQGTFVAVEPGHPAYNRW